MLTEPSETLDGQASMISLADFTSEPSPKWQKQSSRPKVSLEASPGEGKTSSGIAMQEFAPPPSPELSWTFQPSELLKALEMDRTIPEYQFNSRIPVLGPIIATFRRLWNNVSTRWYVRPITVQQNRFNGVVVQTLINLTAYSEAVAETVVGQAEWLQAQTRWMNAQIQHFAEYQLALQLQFDDQRVDVDDLGKQLDQLGEQLDRLREQFARVSQALDQQIGYLSSQQNSMQNSTNNAIVKLEYSRQRLADTLAEYLREDGREIGELAREVEQLKARIGQFPEAGQ
jgi:hypothetical protein